MQMTERIEQGLSPVEFEVVVELPKRIQHTRLNPLLIDCHEIAEHLIDIGKTFAHRAPSALLRLHILVPNKHFVLVMLS